MEIRHNKKKEEMRHDPVLDAVADVRSYVENNRNIVLGAVGVLVAALVVVQVVLFVNKQNQAKAADLLGKAELMYLQDPGSARTTEALSQVSARYSGTVHAVYSEFLIANEAYRKGQFDLALTHFEKAANGSGDAGFVRGEAVEGIGKCHEGKGDYEGAATYYNKVLADKSMAYRHPEILWRMALINQKLSRNDKATEFCAKILADTAAFAYRQKAASLSAEIAAAH